MRKNSASLTTNTTFNTKPRKYYRGIKTLESAVSRMTTYKNELKNTIKLQTATVAEMGNVIKRAKTVSEDQIKSFIEAQITLSNSRRKVAIYEEYLDKVKVMRKDPSFQSLLQSGDKAEINRVIKLQLGSKDQFIDRVKLYGGSERALTFKTTGGIDFKTTSVKTQAESAFNKIKSGEYSIKDFGHMLRARANKISLNVKDQTFVYNLKQKVLANSYVKNDEDIQEVDMYFIENFGMSFDEALEDLAINGKLVGVKYDSINSVADIVSLM